MHRSVRILRIWLLVLAMALVAVPALAGPSAVGAKKKHHKKKHHKKKHKADGHVPAPPVYDATITPNVAIPDRAVGATSPYGRVDEAFDLGAAYAGHPVTDVSVTLQTSSTDNFATDDLEFYLAAPGGPRIRLLPDLGVYTQSKTLGPLTFSRHSSVGLCAPAPCPNPLMTLAAPFAGTVGMSYLAILNGLPAAGQWTLTVLDTTYTKASVLNVAGLRVATG